MCLARKTRSKRPDKARVDFLMLCCVIGVLVIVKQHMPPLNTRIALFCMLASLLLSAVLVVFALVTLVVSTILLTRQKEPWVGAGDFLSKFSWDGKRPLKIAFITWGSRGDHQPNVALGLELAKRGHQVSVMGLERYRSVIERHPELRYIPYEDHVFPMASELNKPGNESRFPAICAKFVSDSSRELIPQYINTAEEADVIVGQQQPLCVFAQFTAAQVAKKPLFFTAHDAAVSLPTTAFSYNPSSNRIRDHGWLANIINTRAIPIIVGIFNTLSPRSELRAYRRELGLTTRWPFMEMLGPRAAASIPTFCTWDPTLWPAPKDYSPHWFSTGFFSTKHNNADDSDGVLDWIQRRSKLRPGRKLIYAALGSFDHHDRKLFTDLLLQAAEELSLDVVTLNKTVYDRTMPPNVFVADEVPQPEVFQRCEVVVHHGGAGTSAQVIRSGRPGICVPAMHIQQTWGARLEEYGAGLMVTQSEIMEAHRTTCENKLLHALQGVMTPEIMAKAESLGKAAREAPGVKLAADKMIEYLQAAAV